MKTILKIILTLLILLFNIGLNAQKKKADFNVQIDSILKTKPNTYKGINTVKDNKCYWLSDICDVKLLFVLA